MSIRVNKRKVCIKVMVHTTVKYNESRQMVGTVLLPLW